MLIGGIAHGTSPRGLMHDRSDAFSFTYDQGTNGIGHLTGVSDANHSMSFTSTAGRTMRTGTA
jgi:hypothetical protein